MGVTDTIFKVENGGPKSSHRSLPVTGLGQGPAVGLIQINLTCKPELAQKPEEVVFEPSLGGEAILDGHGEGWQGPLRGQGLAGSLEEGGQGEGCTLGRASTRSCRALWMLGKELGVTAGWGAQGTQSKQSF